MFDAAGAGHTILVPNTELAAALFDAVERLHIEAGHDLWPTPHIRDFGSWLKERYGERQRSDASLPRVLSDIEERELWRAAIDASDVGEGLVEPAGAARAARRARRALHEYGIPLRAIADHASAAEESRVFLDWNRLFDERCRQLDCISADELLGRTPPSAEPLTWIESPVWRPMARPWLLRHGRMLAPPGDDSDYRRELFDAFVDLLTSSRRGLLARRLRMLLGRAKRWYGAAL